MKIDSIFNSAQMYFKYASATSISKFYIVQFDTYYSVTPVQLKHILETGAAGAKERLTPEQEASMDYEEIEKYYSEDYLSSDQIRQVDHILKSAKRLKRPPIPKAGSHFFNIVDWGTGEYKYTLDQFNENKDRLVFSYEYYPPGYS